MYSALVEKIGKVAITKVSLMEKSIWRYLLLSALAGIYVGFGVLLIMTIGGLVGPSPFKKVLMGVSFGVALSLVIMAGSELFTGNNMIMTVASLDKKVAWSKTWKLWTLSYTGNLVGSIAIGGLFVLAGLSSGAVADFIVSVSAAKMGGSFMVLFYRGILCNMLVCLAVMISIKSEDETAKLIMIFWCLFAFITAGFEHSIANMTIFTIGLLTPNAGVLSLSGFFANLIPVTLGNMVGGGVFIGGSYWLIGRE